MKRGLVIALFFLFSYSIFGQNYFNNLYNESLGGYTVAVSDSSYFLTTRILKNGYVGLVTIDIDTKGQLINADTLFLNDAALYSGYAGSGIFKNVASYFLGIIRISPTNSLIGFFKSSNNLKNQEIARLKFQDSISVVPYGLTNKGANSIAITGYAFKHIGGQQEYQRQLLLMQLDTLGNKLWERSYPAKTGLWHLQGNSIIATQSGGFAIGGGGAYAASQKQSFAYILVTDSLGNKVNERYFMNDDFGNFVPSIQQMKNGNFIIAYSEAYKLVGATANASSRKIIIEELEENTLNTVWHKEYFPGHQNTRGVSRLIPQNDSTYLIAGYYYPDYILYEGDYAAQLGYIFAINAQGDSLWYRDYNNGTDSSEYNYLNDIAVTLDGGIVGAGRLQTPKSPYTGGLANHVWLFKTDSIGCLYPSCDTVYTKPKAPVTEFKVYPNPLQNGQDLMIELPNATSATAILYNAIGQMIFKSELEFSSGTASLSAFGEGRGWVTSGIFILHIQTSTGSTHTQKVVFQ